MINSYQFGQIQINGKTYTHDVAIIGDTVRDWFREEGHFFSSADLTEIPEETQIVIIGTGASGCLEVSPAVSQSLEEKGCQVIIQKTDPATLSYNRLLKEGRKTAGFFHLTC